MSPLCAMPVPLHSDPASAGALGKLDCLRYPLPAPSPKVGCERTTHTPDAPAHWNRCYYCFVCAWCWPRVAWVRGWWRMWILRWPFMVTFHGYFVLFVFSLVCDVRPCMFPPTLLLGILQPTTSRRLQPLKVCRPLALALSVRLGARCPRPSPSMPSSL